MSAAVQDMRERLKRWPLIAQPSNRSESFLKDARLVNCFAERDPNTDEYWIQKRIGYTLDYNIPGSFVAGAGMYSFGTGGVSSKSVYSIFISVGFPGGHGTMFKDGVAFGTVGGLDPTLYSGATYFFTEDEGGHLVFASSLTLYYTTGAGGWTAVATPLPGGNNYVGLTFLDQTIYFMDNAGNIFGSAFNDPTTWTATNKVIANSIPGVGVGLTSQLNYILALKSNSMEVFYDAGNPPPGSPLSPVAGALSNYGCVYGSNQVIDDIVMYVTSNKTVSPQVVRIDNLQVSIVSTPAIDRMLDQVGASVLISWTFKHGGHRFYGISSPTTVPSFTLVYDIDQKLWYQWSDVNGNFFPVIATAFDSSGRHVLQFQQTGVLNTQSVFLFEGDYQYPTDNGVVVPVDIYTPNADFGTRRNKTLHRMYFNADQTPGSMLYVSRSDDDYQHFSRPRKVDLSRRTPYLEGESTFTRRAYHFRHAAPTAFRIRSVDLQMELGTI